jgi:type II secretory pathway component PulJ
MVQGILKRLLPKRRQQRKKMHGFTLIELLVAMLMATIIIGTLLTFLTNILETNRKEEAKVQSQEELQAAVDFIADDLQEAVFIYDADSLARLTGGNSSTACATTAATPGLSPTCSQIPAGTDKTPVLVFWKRSFYKEDSKVTAFGRTGDTEVRCLPDPLNQTKTTATTCLGSDRFVYSLVAYYLIKDTNPSYSNTSRIGRWEFKDGISSTCQNITTPASCAPGVTTVNSVNYWVPPDTDFRPFDLSLAGTLSSKMSNWYRASNGYDSTDKIVTLVDFVDDTPYDPIQDDATPNNSPIETIIPNTPPNPTLPITTPSTNADCDDGSKGVGNSTPGGIFTQRIPSSFSTTATGNDPRLLSSFYACVNTNQNIARVWIRGNAYARIFTARALRSPSNSDLFPTASVRAFGRGSLSTSQ